MILLTGSEGKIGRVLKECFTDKICIDRVAGADIVLNLADNLSLKISDVDTVIHLAANPSPAATWPELFIDNILAARNVLELAIANKVKRFIFASSNWVVKGLERALAPDCYTKYGRKINGADCFPVNPYGESKVYTEITGKFLTACNQLESFVAVRIGSFHQRIPDDPIWIGDRDMQSLFQRCVEAKIYGFHVVYGVSAQWQSPYNLHHTKDLLDWTPREHQ